MKQVIQDKKKQPINSRIEDRLVLPGFQLITKTINTMTVISKEPMMKGYPSGAIFTCRFPPDVR
jgi:hypothetical protein